MPERMSPQDIEAEQGVLGSILIDPEVLPAIIGLLVPEDFFRDSHRTIFTAIREMDSNRDPVDFVTICSRLESQGKLENAGGSGYISSLINCVPTSGNAEYYAQIVQEKSIRRKIIHASGKIAAWAFDEAIRAEEALARSEALLRTIANSQRTGRPEELAALSNAYLVTLEELTNLTRSGIVTGIPTGFRRLNVLTGGFQRSDLIVLAGRPGRGKTASALSLGVNAMSAGFNVLLFSLEMAKWQVVQRILAGLSGISQTRLRLGQIDPLMGEWDQIVGAVDSIPEGKFWIDDTAGLNVSELRSRARRHQSEYGVDLLIVDYAQLMHAHRIDGKSFENRQEEVATISRNLKELARELNIPVIALAQLSRDIEKRQNKRPVLSDLKESGAIEQDADIVMFLHQDEEDEPLPNGSLVIRFLVEKHRNGALDEIPVEFIPHLTLFRDLSSDVVAPDREPLPFPRREESSSFFDDEGDEG